MKRRHMILPIVLIVLGMVLSFVTASSGMQVRIRTFSLLSEDGQTLTGKAYIPVGASAENKVPAVLTCAGGNNEYVRHENTNTELASRGYAVFTFNPYKHGDSSVYVTQDMGASDMLNYIGDLDFVDSQNIALEGHTMGGAFLTLAAIAQPEKVQSLILLDAVSISHSLSGIDDTFPLNITWIISRYNEHLPDPTQVFSDPELVTTFGIDSPAAEGVIYGNAGRNTLRAVYMATSTVNTHGFSPDMIGKIVDTLTRTMDVPVQRSSGLQIWPLLMLGKLLSFLGIVWLIFSLIALLFKQEHSPVTPTQNHPSKIRILLSFSAPLLIAILFIPVYTMGKRALNPSFIFPQTDSNGLAILAVLGVCIYWGSGYLLYRRDRFAPSNHTLLALELRAIGQTFLKALGIFGIVYGINLLYQWVFGDHITLGCMTLSSFTPRKALALISYFPVYLLLFISASLYRVRSLHLVQSSRNKYWLSILLSCGGEAALLIAGFLPFLFTGKPGLYEGRFAIGMIMYILPLLPVFGMIDVYSYKRTGTVWLGAFLNTMLFSWAFVATNALELMW